MTTPTLPTTLSDKAALDRKLLLERAAAQNAREAALSNLTDLSNLDLVHQQHVPVLYVTEETFLETVEENIKEFNMSSEDSIIDAIKQFGMLKRIVPDCVVDNVRRKIVEDKR